MDKTVVKNPIEKIIPTFCHGCGAAKTRCAILCHVVDGKFVRVEGNPEAGNNWGQGCASLCAKGNTGPQFMYAPNRLQYPMKRVGAKGEGKFQRIPWDEALETIAYKLKENKAKYGAESFGVFLRKPGLCCLRWGDAFSIFTAVPTICTALSVPLPEWRPAGRLSAFSVWLRTIGIRPN